MCSNMWKPESSLYQMMPVYMRKALYRPMREKQELGNQQET